MSLGLGSVVAVAVETAPWLAVVSRYKSAIFLGVGAILVFNYWLAVLRPRRQNCAPGDICHVDSPQMRFNRAMFWASVAIYLTAIALTSGASLWLRFSDLS